MATPKTLVLRAPGTNCDQETVHAFAQAGSDASALHINRLIEQPQQLDDAQILCIAGGFSYGDDLGAGRVLATQIRLTLADRMREFHEQGKLILGICNGFQVLVQAGLLLGAADGTHAGALAFNDSAKFEDRWVPLEVASPRCIFLRDIERMYLPVAHAEGKVVLGSVEQLAELREAQQVALRYGTGEAETADYPANPNGSTGDIAGICDATGRILGLMPHPERYVHYTQHPRWTRETLPEHGDGMAVFENAVAYFR